MFLIKYKSDSKGCPKGGVYGRIEGFDWNSNDYSDARFPSEGTILEFYTDHKFLDADFFYFGSEFICSNEMLKVIKEFRHGAIDLVELVVYLKSSSPAVSSKKYFLVRSREIRTLLDAEASVYEFRLDPKTNLPEVDVFHKNRYIYDMISKFVVSRKKVDLDFFICSEMLMGEYVFSSALKTAIESARLKGFSFVAIEDHYYDARLEF